MANKNNSSKVSKGLTYQERRDKIRELATEIGLLNINKESLARRFDVSVRTIYRDIRRVVESSRYENVDLLRFIMGSALSQALKKAQKILLRTDDDRVALKACKTIANITEKLTGFAERYGIKEKVAERIEIEGEVTTKTFVELYKEYHATKKSNTTSNKKERSKSTN